MNKKILITILTILGLAVVVGGFYLWLQKKADLMHVNVEKRIIENDKQEQKGDGGNRKNGIVEKEDEGKKEGNGNQENEKQVEIDYNPHTQLTKQEIEKLKKEKDLVWYEIPELEIKFLVTKDAKEDLGYVVRKNKDQFKKDNTIVLFYNLSEINFKKNRYNQDVCFNKKNELECHNWISFTKISFKYNEYLKKKFGADSGWVCHKDTNNGEKELLQINNDYIICYDFNPQAFNWTDTTEYNEYLKTIKDKHLKIYLNTIQLIQTK